MAPRRTTWLVGLLLVVGCSVEQEEPGLQPADEGTPLAAYTTSGLSIARADFCAQISGAAVERALGSPGVSTAHYASGEPIEVSTGGTDIGHEFNCSFTSADGSLARGWVFAPPVAGSRAAELTQEMLKQPGCTPIPGAPAFGKPSVAIRCQANGSEAVSFHGLFVDAWLSCSVSRPVSGPVSAAASVKERADLWCVAVAQGAHDAFVDRLG